MKTIINNVCLHSDRLKYLYFLSIILYLSNFDYIHSLIFLAFTFIVLFLTIYECSDDNIFALFLILHLFLIEV
jgi:hypothetical protein